VHKDHVHAPVGEHVLVLHVTVRGQHQVDACLVPARVIDWSTWQHVSVCWTSCNDTGTGNLSTGRYSSLENI
jgi:hypothetical protein